MTRSSVVAATVRRLGTTLAIPVLIGLPASASGLQQEPGVESLVRGRIEAIRVGMDVGAGGDALLARRALTLFYEARAFSPAWSTNGSGPSIAELVREIGRADEHGLDPADYHLSALDSLLALVRAGDASDAELADLELLASDAYMVLGSHLLHGRVNPETINPEWLANRRSAELHEVLADAIERDGIAASLAALEPAQPRYAALVRRAADLRDIAEDGGWPTVAGGERLEIGVEAPRVATLRRRLIASGDLGHRAGADEFFDEGLADGVRTFQRRHGLEADGVVGPATIAALNVPPADRALQIEVNLERWRWLPADLGARHVEVNIAGFEARVVERGRTVRTHRAVVGRQYRQTPMFSGSMTYLVLAPYWHVPPTIAAVDKLPLIRQNPGYVAAQRMTLLDQRTNEPREPASVEWATMTGADFNRRFRLRQDPGPLNALGSVKFMFRNRHNVYLHDTPSRELFDRAARSFSSGCIRIENPLALAEYLLADQPQWTPERIREASSGASERTVRLTEPVPVHLLYWTAWVDENGLINFRDDLYGRDVLVRRGLEAEPPGP